MHPLSARRSDSETPSNGSCRSPLTGTSSLPPGPHSLTSRSNLPPDPGLTNTQMGSPRAASSTTTCRPMNPVAPVRKYPMRKTLHRICRDPYRGKPRGPKTLELSESTCHDNGREHVGRRPGMAADGAADEPDGR